MRAFLVGLFLLGGSSAGFAHPARVPHPLKLPTEPKIAVDYGSDIQGIAFVNFSADGKRLLSAGVNTIQIWDVATREQLKSVRLPSMDSRPYDMVNRVTDAILSPDGKTVAAFLHTKQPGLSSHDLFLIQLDTGRMMWLPEAKGTAFQAGINATFTFSPDGDWLAVSSQGKLLLWRGMKKWWHADAPPVFVMEQLPKLAQLSRDGLRFSPDSSKLAVGNASGNGVGAATPIIEIWNLQALKTPPKTIIGPAKSGAPQLVWSPLGNRLGALCFSVGGWNAAVWTVDGLLLRSMSGGWASVISPAPVFRDENDFIMTWTSAVDKKAAAVVRFDVKNNRVEDLVPFPAPDAWHGVKIAPDGKRLAMISTRPPWSLATLDLEPNAKPQLFVSAVPVTPKFALGRLGYQFAWTGSDREKFIAGIDLATAEPLAGPINAKDFLRPSSNKYDVKPLHSRGGLVAIKTAGLAKAPDLLEVYAAGQDWVVWTNEGYYAASPGGEKLVGWQINNGMEQLPSFYPLERFRKKFYRPDIIALVLDRGSVAEAVQVADALRGEDERVASVDDSLPPRAVLSLLQQDKASVKLKVQAEAAARKQPITALRLLVDGRPLPDGSAYNSFGQGKSLAEADWSVTLAPGKHQLTVLARSTDSSSKSNTIEVAVADPDKLHALHVLAIGVNDYQDAALKLDFAAKDAQDIAAGFQKASKGELFQDVHGAVVTNAGANKAAILSRLSALRKEAKPNDLVVVFFAGHGVKEKDKFYLLPVEAKTDNLAGTAISGAELRKGLGEFPCQVLLMLDACHSSGGVKNFRPAVDDITRNLTDDDCGVAVMCSAMAHEKALEKDGNGLFTKAVVQALNRAEGVPFDRYSRLFYVSHLHAYVFDEVRHHSGDRQHPFLSLPWVVESFPVAKFAASTAQK